MVRLMKIIWYIVFFLIMLVYFIPKTGLYYKTERILQRYDIIISKETIKDNSFSLNIQNATIVYNSMDIAKVESVNIETLLVKNSIYIKNIYLSSFLKNFLPLKIDTIKLSHTLLNPVVINIESKGEFGNIHGSFDLIKRLLYIKLKPSKIMSTRYKKTLREFKKSKNGGYTYEKSI